MSRWKNAISFYFLLTIAMLIRAFPFGIKYYAYLDDYNIYGIFYHFLQAGEHPLAIYTRHDMYATRPLAGLLDVVLAAPLWPRLWVVLLLMTLLYAATLPLTEAVFKRCGLPWGKVAALAMGLYPLLDESIYWVNAALRIVPGFFCLMLSAYFLCVYFEKKRWYHGLGTALMGVFSLGFYEQTVSFGFALLLIVIYAHQKKRMITGRNKVWYAWPIVYVGAFGVYYAVLMRFGRMASRAALADGNLLGTIGAVFNKIFRQLVFSQGYTLVNLFTTEFPRFARQPADFIIPVALCLLLAALLTLRLGEQETLPGGNKWVIIISAVCLFLAAFGPFFLLRDSFLKMRNVFFCVPTFAMLAQWVWDSIKNKGKLIVYAAALFTAVCMLLGIGTVSAYRVNYQTDNANTARFLDLMRTSDSARKIWIFGARYQFAAHGGVHLESSFLSDWALSGLADSLSLDKYGENIVTFASDGRFRLNPVVTGWPYEWNIDIAQDRLLGMTSEGSFVELWLDGDVLRDTATHEIFGTVARDGTMFRYVGPE